MCGQTHSNNSSTMAKHTLKILRCSHRKIFKVCLAIAEYLMLFFVPESNLLRIIVPHGFECF